MIWVLNWPGQEGHPGRRPRLSQGPEVQTRMAYSGTIQQSAGEKGPAWKAELFTGKGLESCPEEFGFYPMVVGTQEGCGRGGTWPDLV